MSNSKEYKIIEIKKYFQFTDYYDSRGFLVKNSITEDYEKVFENYFEAQKHFFLKYNFYIGFNVKLFQEEVTFNFNQNGDLYPVYLGGIFLNKEKSKKELFIIYTLLNDYLDTHVLKKSNLMRKLENKLEFKLEPTKKEKVKKI